MGQVSFSVPMIPQGDNPICWIGCVAMITSWKTQTTHSISEFTGGFDPSNSCIPNPAGGWQDMYNRLNQFGFMPDGANMCLDNSYIEGTLRSHGPFMIFVFAADFPFYGPMCLKMNGNPTDTHAVVISGVDTDAGTVQIMNPWGTATPPADIDVIIGLMQAVSNQGLNCASFMP
jgi:Papain-like cysteine protease AvrRpt2